MIISWLLKTPGPIIEPKRCGLISSGVFSFNMKPWNDAFDIRGCKNGPICWTRHPNPVKSTSLDGVPLTVCPPVIQSRKSSGLDVCDHAHIVNVFGFGIWNRNISIHNLLYAKSVTKYIFKVFYFISFNIFPFGIAWTRKPPVPSTIEKTLQNKQPMVIGLGNWIQRDMRRN